MNRFNPKLIWGVIGFAVGLFIAQGAMAQEAMAQEVGGSEDESEVQTHSTTQYDSQPDRFGRDASDPEDNGFERSGFWGSFGLGVASLGVEDESDRIGGGAVLVELGGSISERVLLGAGIHGWGRTEDDETLTVGTTTFMGRFYPSVDDGFHAMAGIGVGVIEYSVGNISVSDEGGGAILGLGYDVPISRSWTLTPFLRGAGVEISDTRANFGQLGLALTYH